jgi:beta-1,4-mannosyl-glycoprotein beta-1,4-N-acetylglucosaminyltransferase
MDISLTFRKIIDCFIFYNEIELLTYRLNVLNDVVDYFVIVESTHTHVGKEKKLYFNENKNLFENFMHKIIHIVVEDFPYKYPNVNIEYGHQWRNENFQRDCISRGLEQINLKDNDCIIIVDLDEIPDPDTLLDIKKGNIMIELNTLCMDFYYYNLNTLIDENWIYPKIISYKKFKELNIGCNAIRYSGSCPIIEKGGWHLSYFGDSNFIKNKITHFAHQEHNHDEITDIKKIEERVNKGLDLFKREITLKKISLYNNLYLPPKHNVYLKNFYK